MSCAMSRTEKSVSSPSEARARFSASPRSRQQQESDVGQHHQHGAGQQQVARADQLRRAAREFAAEGRADHHGHAQQRIHAVGLARIESIAGHQPPLRHQHDAEQADEDAEHVQHPRQIEAEQPPDRTRHATAVIMVPVTACGSEVLHRGAAVRVGHGSPADGDQDDEERQVVHIELVEEHRLRNRLEDVVGEQHAEQVGEHQEGAEAFPRPDVINSSPQTPHLSHEGITMRL